ncbi:hypothetical protein HYE07_03730 [Mycoplasmopsis bovis]|nr:hypothetical protein [Mycoplasmopsis bovis]QQH27418.1 hypothetical protein HYE07_03730 [Mycoplasmopsis bovis]
MEIKTLEEIKKPEGDQKPGGDKNPENRQKTVEGENETWRRQKPEENKTPERK